MSRQQFAVGDNETSTLPPQAQQMAIAIAQAIHGFKTTTGNNPKMVVDSAGRKIAGSQSKRKRGAAPPQQPPAKKTTPPSTQRKTMHIDDRLAAIWNNPNLPKEVKYSLTNSIGKAELGENWISLNPSGEGADDDASSEPKQEEHDEGEVEGEGEGEVEGEGGENESGMGDFAPTGEHSILSYLGINGDEE